MVIVDNPAVAVFATVRVRMLDVVALAGLNDAVTPAGKPLALRATEPLKLLMPVTVTVLLPLVPATTLTLPGVEDKE
jgi:hypothetical protein